MTRLVRLCQLLTCLWLAACANVPVGRGGQIQISASGEALALSGYAYPPVDSDSPAFVDGWQISFSKLLVTIDHVRLSENPDRSPTDQSLVGKRVAQLDGPFAIDLHAGGPLPGAGGGGEQAYPLGVLADQNLNGHAPFDPTLRYALGFDVVPATDSAVRLQLADDDPDYADMIANGYSVLYVGTAVFRGSDCRSSDPSFDFGKLPTRVDFRLGFTSPSTYENCQNPNNDPAEPLGEEEHERGVQVKLNQTVIAQVTIHTDHPFWESLIHDSPAHFDPLAALAQPDDQGNYRVTLDAARGMNYTAFEFRGQPLPWRSCLPSYSPPIDDPQLSFDSLGVPHNPSGDPAVAFRDYFDYATYNQSTQGHLNSDGLCFVHRNYPSPP